MDGRKQPTPRLTSIPASEGVRGALGPAVDSDDSVDEPGLRSSGSAEFERDRLRIDPDQTWTCESESRRPLGHLAREVELAGDPGCALAQDVVYARIARPGGHDHLERMLGP